jgi:hypothetical protein
MLKIIPLDLKEANYLVKKLHRHHKPAVGHRFSLGVIDGEGNVIGCVIASRPIARLADQKFVLEITRVATDGSRNACSILLGAVSRTAKAMGYARVQTTTLSRESGSSLKAVGWKSQEINQDGTGWDSRSGRNVDCKNDKKVRWWVDFGEVPNVKKIETGKKHETKLLFD